MTQTGILTRAELNNKTTAALPEDQFRIWSELLLKAIDDWPTKNLNEPSVFLEELRRELKTPLTFDYLKKYSKQLTLSIEGNAWKMESIASVLEMFAINNGDNSQKQLTLDDIIERLTKHYRQ